MEEGLIDSVLDEGLPLEAEEGDDEVSELVRAVSRHSLAQGSKGDEGGHIAIANRLLQRHDVQASFAITGVKMLNISEGMNIFTILDTMSVGKISLDELVKGCNSNQKVRSVLVKYEDTPLALLSNSRLVRVMLQELNLQNEGAITVAEWRDFLALLVAHDIRFLVIKGLNSLRCYWGRGIDADDEGAPRDGQRRTPPWWDTWLRDFWYYQCNNHPIVALFLREPDHPLGVMARLNIEFVCLSFGLFMSGWLYPEKDFETILLYITLPIVVIRNTLMFTYKCPCLVVRHEVTMARKCSFSLLRAMGRVFGFAFFVVAVVFLFTGPITWDGEYIFYYSWMTAWWESYVFCVGVDVLVKFNPVPQLFRLSNCALPCGGDGGIGFCRWQRERALAYTRIAEDNLCGASAGSNMLRSEFLFETQVQALTAAFDTEKQKVQTQIMDASEGLRTRASQLCTSGVAQLNQAYEHTVTVAKRRVQELTGGAPSPSSSTDRSGSTANPVFAAAEPVVVPLPIEQTSASSQSPAVAASLGSLEDV
jgi:hypothetical protein